MLVTMVGTANRRRANSSRSSVGSASTAGSTPVT
jgi:hypothetical protein